MLKNRLISALLIVSLIAGTTACSMDAAKDNGNDGRKETVTEDHKPENGEETAESHEDPDTGYTVSNTTTDSETTTEDDTGAGRNGKDLITPDVSEDFILFSYEHGNMAWGYQSEKMLILNNGDAYVFENAPGTAGDQNGRDLAVAYLKQYSEPSYHMSTTQLRELYDICKKIDPDVKTGEKDTAKDMGSYVFKFYDPETAREVTIIKTGDMTMTTDDKTLIKAREKAESILGRQGVINKDLYLSLSSSITNVPYGGKDLIGKNMSFDSYDKLLEFCSKNGIDVEKYLTELVKKSYQEAKYIILQVYDTNLLVDGYLNTDNKEFRFLPSLADYEYNPDFDGKVTVAICRCDQLEKFDFVNENGSPWK